MSRWDRREFTVACASALAGLLVGCQRERPTIETVSEQPVLRHEPTLDDLHAILDRRVGAVRAGDEQAFLADLDQSNAQLLERQAMVFANLRQLPFKNLRFETPGVIQPLPDPATGVSTFAPVIGIAKLKVDAAPGGVAPAEAFRYDLVHADGRAQVTDVVPLTRRNAGDFSVRPEVYANAPWNTTPLEVVNVGNVWLAGDESVPELRDYAAAAQAQAGAVEALWGDRSRWPGYIMFFTRKKSNFRKWYDFRLKGNQFEGFQTPLTGVRRTGEVFPGRYAGARIVVNLANIELFGDDPALVMRHELAHAVSSRVTAVGIGLSEDFSMVAPRWAIEGFARWVENQEHPQRQAGQRAVVAEGLRAGRFGDAPPDSETFYDRPDIDFNYAVSSTVFSFTEQAAGRDAVIELYARAVDHTDMTGSPLVTMPAFDGICQEVLGMGSADFLQQWSRFVRNGAQA